MKRLINRIISKITGNRYWYSVRFIYHDKNGKRLFDYYSEVGLSNKSDVLNHRIIKTTESPLHKIKRIPRIFLCNGLFQVEVISYLGWINHKG